MKFEIINPSDEAYLEADDFKTACIASMMVTEQHGLRQVDGDLEMPPLLFGTEWFDETFKETPTEAYKKIPKKELVKVLRSFHLAGERSSVRDFVKYAHELADGFEEIVMKE